MTDVGKVNADLVGAARGELKPQQGIVAQPLQHLPMGDGRSPPFEIRDRHFFQPRRMPTNGRVYRAMLRLGCAVDDAVIEALGGFGFDLLLKMLEGVIGFRHDDRAASVFIQPMDNARPFNPANPG